MIKDSREYLFKWLPLLYAAAGTLLVFLPFALCSADFGEFFYVLFAVPIVSLVLIILAVKKAPHRLSILSSLIVVWIISAALVQNYSAVRDFARWCLWSNSYKARVLGQSLSESGGLQHTEWDGWGFAGADTVVYLVFDPKDSLVAVPSEHPPGKFSGIPCAVPLIRRLESHWYAVVFYTDTSWGHCTSD